MYKACKTFFFKWVGDCKSFLEPRWYNLTYQICSVYRWVNQSTLSYYTKQQCYKQNTGYSTFIFKYINNTMCGRGFLSWVCSFFPSMYRCEERNTITSSKRHYLAETWHYCALSKRPKHVACNLWPSHVETSSSSVFVLICCTVNCHRYAFFQTF